MAVLARGCVLYKYQEEFEVEGLQLHHGSEVLLYEGLHVKAAAIAGTCVPSQFQHILCRHNPRSKAKRIFRESYAYQHNVTKEGQAFSLDV